MFVEAVAFVPPAVEYREVEHAVHFSLFARCARCFQRTGRGVQPDVYAGNKALGHNHIVVLEEYYLSEELGHARYFGDALDKALAGAVGGVGLAREDKLNGELLVVYDACEAVEVGKEKVGALVGGEAACEADDECVGIDFVNDVHHSGGIALVGKPFLLEIAAYKVYEFVLESHSHIPYFLVGNVEYALPCLGIALAFKYLRAENVVVELFPFRCGPSRHMDTVGHIAHMAFFPCVAFPYAGEHFLGYLSVEPAYAVGFLTGVEREHAHGETFVGVGVFTAHIHKVVPAYAEFGRIFAHILAEEAFVEVVVAGGYRGVHGVERRCAYKLESHVEAEAVFLHVVYEALQVEKRCMAFVGVVELAVDAEFLEHQHAADTEKVFLLDAVFPVAAIELVGDRTVKLAVHVEVGVHQVELHTAYVHTPYVGVDDAAGVGHFENHRTSVFLEYLLYGQLVEVLGLVVGYLLAVDRECLGEIAVAVEEAYCGHVHAAVGGFFYIVAGKHAEAAGIYLEAVAKTVFHREI